MQTLEQANPPECQFKPPSGGCPSAVRCLSNCKKCLRGYAPRRWGCHFKPSTQSYECLCSRS
ncbi:hypothetical protein SLEP1_g56268 [Rubroshorea leprosula]|uniref:Uncharacterized protein n=1 Tax=Rubroshorea leprosula TaxID=152421 RepID=A0AAV5MJ29_9ROSI|nr:hypothetical protein SLEP1_g56268 [Rubroshorea leprosula]